MAEACPPFANRSRWWARRKCAFAHPTKRHSVRFSPHLAAIMAAQIVNARPRPARDPLMKRLLAIRWFTAMAALLLPVPAGAQNRAAYEKLVADHAKANHVPEALVHRVIVRESKYHPDLVGH